MGRALIHFDNLSTATRRWVKPLGACRRGPTMKRFRIAKGHVMGVLAPEGEFS
jgi:hypothetical protein